MTFRTFDDFTPGEVIDLGTRDVSAEEIVAFASEFDAQPMHLDEAAGRASMLGGLSASGWHTASMFMRMMCDAFLLDSASLGAPGIDTLKWVAPVRPGDRLSGRSIVLETRASASRPTMGVVRFRHEITNQHGAVVMWMENPILFGRRTTGEAAT